MAPTRLYTEIIVRPPSTKKPSRNENRGIVSGVGSFHRNRPFNILPSGRNARTYTYILFVELRTREIVNFDNGRPAVPFVKTRSTSVAARTKTTF